MPGSARGARTLVGGVGYHGQRDASFGPLAIEALRGVEWPDRVEVVDLGSDPVGAARDIGEGVFERAVLIAGVRRGRRAGRIYVRRWTPPPVPPVGHGGRIRESGEGFVDLDHLLMIAGHFAALPPDVLLVEIEPLETGPGEGLSRAVAALLPLAVDRVRREVLQARADAR